MRVTHRQNFFHRIKCWTGTHFRQAELWEVGTYLLVQHQTDQPICNALQFQINYLGTFEDMKDKAEQESANQQADDWHRPSSHHSALAMTDNMADEIGADDETRADAAFFDSLDGLWHQGKDNIGHTEDSLQDFFDGNGNDECEVEHADEDIHGFEPYLPHPDSMQRNQRVEQTDAELETGNAEPSTRVLTADALNNSYIRVVHTNGIHHLAMVTCHCQGEHRIPLELVASCLLPTSFTKIRTLFTVQVLDHFRLCDLELKASAYQFYQLIRRVTLPMRPAEVVNLYHELRRMSRLWRWMKRLKWIGYGHNQKDPLNPDPGSLANFCPACPQVGINIPENWKDDVNRWVTKYLDCAVASKMLLCYKACDRTGVVAIACARHGCYAPNALVDLFRGEQQKNVDFALLQALKTTKVDPQQGVMLIYDIVCQYIIHIMERIGAHLPAGLTIDRAIGLFHVHGHKDECFFRYAPTFIPGSGIVAGEILESLWSSLNSISPTVRTATLPHRAEMLDDHASDSNHKKMLSMTSTLCSKYQEALEMSTQLGKHHAELTATFGQQVTEKWEDEVTSAESTRLADVRVMDMYATQGMGTGIAAGLASGGLASASEIRGSGTGTGATETGMGETGKGASSGSASSSTSTSVQSAVEEWIDFAII